MDEDEPEGGAATGNRRASRNRGEPAKVEELGRVAIDCIQYDYVAVVAELAVAREPAAADPAVAQPQPGGRQRQRRRPLRPPALA